MYYKILSSGHLHRPLLLQRNPGATVWKGSLHCQATTFEYITTCITVHNSIFPYLCLSYARKNKPLSLPVRLDTSVFHAVSLCKNFRQFTASMVKKGKFKEKASGVNFLTQRLQKRQ